jgi:general secretion pathway protein K
MHCRRSDRHVGNHHQRGAALVVAMLIFALAAALIVAMKSEFDRFFQRSANILGDEQVQAYLRAGEELAAMVLVRDYDEDKQAGLAQDDLDEIWNSEETKKPFPLDGIGWFQGELEDLQGRFNLNLLTERIAREQSNPDKRFTPAQQQFIRLLQALGEPAVSELEAIAITESVSDWLDSDQETSRDGAEDAYYFGQTPAYRTANRLMSSVSELRAVANMTPEIYQALSPWITVLPQSDTTLNIFTAPPMVLRTINADNDLSPLSEDEGTMLRESGFEDINQLLDNPLFADRKAKMEPIRPLLGRNSHYFLLRARVEVAGREMRLYSVLERRNRTVGAIARAAGGPCAGVGGVPRPEGNNVEKFCAIPL